MIDWLQTVGFLEHPSSEQRQDAKDTDGTKKK
jgi:hypothetical protein